MRNSKKLARNPQTTRPLKQRPFLKQRPLSQRCRRWRLLLGAAASADSAQRFRTRLSQAAGLSDSAINAVWPDWWSDAADASPSAVAELRFSVARKLGLDPRLLLEEEQPRFVWDDSAKYKNFKGDAERERPAITAFGTSLCRMLVKATPDFVPEGIEAEGLRRSILAQSCLSA